MFLDASAVRRPSQHLLLAPTGGGRFLLSEVPLVTRASAGRGPSRDRVHVLRGGQRAVPLETSFGAQPKRRFPTLDLPSESTSKQKNLKLFHLSVLEIALGEVNRFQVSPHQIFCDASAVRGPSRDRVRVICGQQRAMPLDGSSTLIPQPSTLNLESAPLDPNSDPEPLNPNPPDLGT